MPFLILFLKQRFVMVSKLGLWVCIFLCAQVAKLRLLNNAEAIISKRSGEELHVAHGGQAVK